VTDALVYAIGVAISPVAIGSVLVILSSAHALPNAASFAAGWIVGVAAVFALVVHGLDVSDTRPEWIAVLELGRRGGVRRRRR
jgi:Sap, sulfolipid-1-addressing protein